MQGSGPMPARAARSVTQRTLASVSAISAIRATSPAGSSRDEMTDCSKADAKSATRVASSGSIAIRVTSSVAALMMALRGSPRSVS